MFASAIRRASDTMLSRILQTEDAGACLCLPSSVCFCEAGFGCPPNPNKSGCYEVYLSCNCTCDNYSCNPCRC